MNLKNYYYYFQSALTPRMCDDIVAYGKQHQAEMAVTGGVSKKVETGGKLTKKEIKNIQKKRDSDIVWMNDKWIYDAVHPYIHEANKLAGWNFEWDWSESCQFTKYGVGQYYGWHCDSWEEPYQRKQNEDGTYPIDHGKIRKLSVTISLTEPDEYVGGNLEFDFRNQIDWERDKKSKIKECTEIRPRGSIIVFPSFVWHRVAPVTKGVRNSLVVWNLGYPFK
jgi:PKHD-type hydroxylase|tara:strand:- start:5295 stop:5960 length:666 start_codon:yes stop_codon:yes gene_type:complete